MFLEKKSNIVESKMTLFCSLKNEMFIKLISLLYAFNRSKIIGNFYYSDLIALYH